MIVGYARYVEKDIALIIEEECSTCTKEDLKELTPENTITHESIHLILLEEISIKAYKTLDYLCYPKSHGGKGLGITLERYK